MGRASSIVVAAWRIGCTTLSRHVSGSERISVGPGHDAGGSALLCNCLNLIFSARAAFWSLTGMETRPKLKCPFHTVAAITMQFAIRQPSSGVQANESTYIVSNPTGDVVAGHARPGAYQ